MSTIATNCAIKNPADLKKKKKKCKRDQAEINTVLNENGNRPTNIKVMKCAHA